MHTSFIGIELIKQFEGLMLNAYICPAGVRTIGYGHTRTAKRLHTITEEEAEELLVEDLEMFEEGVAKLVKVDIDSNQFDALVSFAYNLGLGNLRRSTLLKKLNSEDFEGVGDEFLRWNKAGGKVLKGLVRRREAERDLFLS